MDQYRAGWAYAQTRETKQHLGDAYDSYVKLAEGMPALIMMCGLGQTVAFYLTKAVPNNQYEALLKNMASWLCKDCGYDNPEQVIMRSIGGLHLTSEIMDNTRDRYHMLIEESLEYLIWLKRFGKALKG